jgi:uncharacterized protein (DUF1810 family)
VDAQAGVHERALAELRGGRKQSHWMWFVFPQISGLGSSPMSQHYAIASLKVARAYLDHPLLGARLRDCTQAVLAVEGRSAHEIFGTPDDLKFRSSMTLFDAAAPEDIFHAALDKYFGGEGDQLTLKRLS